MKLILVLCGIPGSGKSTLSRFISENAQGRTLGIISSDALRLEINGSEESQENAHIVWKRFYDDAFESLAKNDITVLDATFAKRRDRTLVTRLLSIPDEVKIVCIHLDPPFLKSARQNEGRKRVVPGFVLETMYDSLVKIPPSTEEGYDRVITLKSNQEIQYKWQDIITLIS